MSTTSSSRRFTPLPPPPSPFITAQFNRAVSVIQSLPKTGPIQSSYEEKLAMYSLFKQVTIGNVVGPRPGIFDMLKRSKWDAWKSKEHLSKEAAMKAYVGTLLQVLKRYKDRKQARVLIREFEMTSSLEGGPGRSGTGGVGDSATTAGWTGVEGGAEGSASYQPTSSSIPRSETTSSTGSSSSSSSSSGSGSSRSTSSPAQPQSQPLPPPPTHTHHHRSSQPSTAHPTPRQTPPQYFPDPSLPPPDVSPRLMNPSLPKIRSSASEDGRRRRVGTGPALTGLSRFQDEQQQPLSSSAGRYGGEQNQQQQAYLPSSLFQQQQQQQQQPTLPSLPSAFPGPSLSLPPTLLPSSSSQTQTQQPPSEEISLALQKIQTSLSALHSRLTLLESTTTSLTHTAHPLFSLFSLLLSPSRSSTRRIKVGRLIWEILKRLASDAVLVGVGISLWVLLSRRKELVGVSTGRGREVLEFWKALGGLVGRRRRGGGGAVGV